MEIIQSELIAPHSAKPGSRVDFQVDVTQNTSSGLYVGLSFQCDTTITVEPIWVYVSPGEWQQFNAHFFMLDRAVDFTVHVWVWNHDTQQWEYDHSFPGKVHLPGTTVRWYYHEGVYTLPKWSYYEVHWDGIYLNGLLFEQNIPIVDQKCIIVVTPQGSYGTGQWINIGFPTFDKDQNKVVRLGHQFDWPVYSTSPRSVQLDWGGHPYGMGLNTIGIEIDVAIPKNYEMSWFVTYAWEVYI